MNADDIARGKTIFESGRYAPPQGRFLGAIDIWGLDVFENSPQAWKQALLAEHLGGRRGSQ